MVLDQDLRSDNLHLYNLYFLYYLPSIKVNLHLSEMFAIFMNLGDITNAGTTLRLCIPLGLKDLSTYC